ncbi:MAG: 2,3,4,5-tetrahydropyridine-2,6-dicarboxylate N-succinyltransferase [Acidimicrobiales bacterium]
MSDTRTRIEELWSARDDLDASDPDVLGTIHEAIDLLDTGAARVAEVTADGNVQVNEWLKHAIMLLFRTAEMSTIELNPFEFADKIPLKTDYADRGVRVVPGASARWGSYQGPGVVMMPSYTNIGAYVGDNSMVDTWATVGSCAQIGKNVHLAGGVGIGGVLEPAVASPVIIEDEAFIGSRCMITEGSRVGEGAVVGSGVILNGSVPVVDAETGDEVSRGHIPAWSVAVLATRPREFAGGTFGLPCALIIKRLSEGERHDKSALNDALRTHGVAL